MGAELVGIDERLRLPREVRQHVNQSVVAVGAAMVEIRAGVTAAGAATLLILPGSS